MAKLAIHPAADLLPRLTTDELAELAADIAENGQQVPIMLDCEGKVLVDGRNRLEACKLASVEPIFDKLPAGTDLDAYVISLNALRRNCTKGQLAMFVAMIRPESNGRGRGHKSAETADFSQRRLRVARQVLRCNRTLAEAVLKGTTPLDDALKKVQEDQQYQSSDEAKLARLQQVAPDLADQVNEERLKINEAIGALQAREQKLREIEERGKRAANDVVEQFVAKVCSIQEAAGNGIAVTIARPLLDQLTDGYFSLMKLQGYEVDRHENHAQK